MKLNRLLFVIALGIAFMLGAAFNGQPTRAVTSLDPDDVYTALETGRGNTLQNARWVDILTNSMGDINSTVQFGQSGTGIRTSTLEINKNTYFQSAPTPVSELPPNPTNAEMEANLREMREAMLASGIATH